MPKEEPTWRKFSKLKFDSRRITKRAKKVESATTRHAHKFIIKRWDNINDVRQTIIGWVLLVALLIVSVGLQMTWFQEAYRVEAPNAGGTYAEAVLGDIETLNPLYASSSAEHSVNQLLFSSLYSYDDRGGLKADLAQTITADTDNTVYTVKLRSNVKWHDGESLTAEDVVFTINLIKDPDTRSNLSSVWDGIKVVALDDATVQFTLPARIAAFAHALNFPILPKHVLKDVAPSSLRQNSFSTSPIGSGPFKLRLLQTISESEGTKVVHMSGFDEYFRGAPKLNRFQLHTYKSRDDILRALRTNEVNGAADLSNNDVNSVETNRYDVANLAINNGVYALFNTTSLTLRDKTVRQALRVAIDTGEVRDQLAMPVKPLDLPFFANQVEGDLPAVPEANSVKAAEMLTAAGWKLEGDIRKKDGQVLNLKLVTIKDPDYEKVVESLASQWRKVGVKVDTSVADPTDSAQDITQTILQARNYDILVYELMIGADPDVYAYWHSSQATISGRNLSNYSNVIADDALSSARSRTDPALRSAKYLSFARQWVEDAPAIGLYQSNFIYVSSKHARTLTSDNSLVNAQSRYGSVPYWTVEHSTVYKTP